MFVVLLNMILSSIILIILVCAASDLTFRTKTKSESAT